MAKRNREETMRRLIAAVGEILKEKGHAGLGLNKVALQAGSHKKLIYRYFGGLNGLLKAYISSKDYWQPLLKDLNASERGDEEVLPLFIGMFRELFVFFREETEMQKFILWQISVYNPLMRGISEEREEEGTKLLDLTNGHFRDSGVNFRVIAALLLGGIYYLVLHGKNNGSTVAGVDVNREKDREEVLKAIGQVFTWAWSAAEMKAAC